MNYELKIIDDMKAGIRTMYAKGRTPGATFFKLASIPFSKDASVSLCLNPTNAHTIGGPQFLVDAGIELSEDSQIPAFTDDELQTVLVTLRHNMDEARQKVPFKFG
jgi:hypothetical protein